MKIALEIDGKRYESDNDIPVFALEQLLVQAGILEKGDSIEVFGRDEDYIIHRY